VAVIGSALLIAGLLAGITALWAAGTAVLGISGVLLLAGYAARVPDREG
jgi:hypothetical protein